MKNRLEIILFNGPPQSGKDTFARLINNMRDNSYTVIKFTTLMDYMLKPIVEDLPWLKWHEFRETQKDKPIPYLNNKTPRDILIGLSEGYLKPLFGKSFLGEWTARHLLKAYNSNFNHQFIITDCGFQDEFNAFQKIILDAYPEAKVTLVRISRAGTSYDGDSRSPVYNSIGDDCELENPVGSDWEEGLTENIKHLLDKIDAQL